MTHLHPSAVIPRHIGGEDRGETADRGHGLSGGKVGLTKSTLKPAAALALRSSVFPALAGSE
jgi:hypothetical protein